MILTTPEQLKEMKRLREKGWTYKKIGKKFNLHGSTINYKLNETTRKAAKARSKKQFKKMTKEQIKERNKKYQDKGYFTKRYNENEQYRESVKSSNNKFHHKNQENGLCECGGELSGKKKNGKSYKSCKKCRKRNLERYKPKNG